MSYSPLEFLLLFALSSVLVGLLTPRFRNFALKKDIFDRPNFSHKTHQQPVPYLGGVAIIAGVCLVTFTSAAFIDLRSLTLVSSVLLPCLILGLVGLVDDLISLSPWPRLIAQSAVGFFVAFLLVRGDTVGSPTGYQSLDVVITVLFIVGLSNSINFFDNVDGGASGTVMISSAFLALLSYTSGQYYLAGISAVLAGSTLGFLKWNRSPARIYMGDAGSLFLGSLLASLLVRFEPSPISFPTTFFVPLFLVAVPLLDTSVAVISRLVRGVSPLQGARDHLSHRLMRVGVPKVRAVMILWALTLVFGILGTLLSSVPFTFEPILTILGSLLWLVALAYFLRIPATD